jgi:death on curing protein
MSRMRFLTLSRVLRLHQRILGTTGGADGIRDLRIVDAAVAAPKATFDGEDLYPGVFSKAAALCYALVQGHAFVDGNKRVGHAAMAIFLNLNGYKIVAPVDEQERIVLAMACGQMRREQLVTWLEMHTQQRE